MATVIPIGQPVNEAERSAIGHLRNHLPASYLVAHNFEIDRNGELFEVDIAVIAPHAVYLVDVKGTRGLIDVHGSKWYPEGRQPYTSPLIKLRGHCKTLKGLITSSDPSRRELDSIYVDAAIVLTAPNAVVQDPGGRDAPAVTTLAKSVAFFQNAGRIPGRYGKDVGSLHKMILKALRGVAKPRSGPLQFGNWRVEERLSGTDTYTEYRATNSFAGHRSGAVILRAYKADPYLPAAERDQQKTRIANAFTALNHMPGHQGVVGARDFFATDSEDCFVLVTDDVAGQALQLHIDKPTLALTLDQKLRVATDLLSALEHVHEHGVVHRNITPSTILLGSDGRVKLTGFDFARAGSDRTRTIAHEIVDELEPAYLAPEVHGEPSAASPGSDIFSAGLVLYELFVGERPFAGVSEVFDQTGKFATKPSELRGELPNGFDEWLQELCTFDPAQRPSARKALDELSALLEPSGAGDLRADEFVDHYLSRHGNELRPLVDALGSEEVDWLEFKAALLPPPGRADANAADGQWAVAKAVVALANSCGGAVLLGVDDDGRPAPLSDSDPKGYLEKEGWDVFARKVLDAGLFREGGWKTAKRGVWHINVPVLRSLVAARRVTLDGKAAVALIVRPVPETGALFESRNTKDGVETSAYFVRRRGDVGLVDKINGTETAEGWLASRQLTSPRFRGLLDELDAPSGSSDDDREGEQAEPIDYSQLLAGAQLGRKYIVEKRLGKPGAFGVVYKVIDTFGDVSRAVKLVLRDRHSLLDRLKKEYRTLLRTPEHPNVVKVIDADLLPGGGPPFIVFEFVEGLDVGEMIESGLCSPEDALELARQTADGLSHLHQHGVYHCDIKPRNLLWTDRGAKIIDFNVSVLASADAGNGGGSRRYLPPDLDLSAVPQPADLADRDLYALGLTLFEAVTGRYPWEKAVPPMGQVAPDPREWSGFSDLAPELVELMLKAIAPKRADRFGSAGELITALGGVQKARRAVPASTESTSWAVIGGGSGDSEIPPNTNPFVSHLLTLYSQSRRSNSGTRGLDALGEQIYVETALDRDLVPAVLAGEFRLVVISGNAGDGKTAFLQKLETRAEDEGAVMDHSVSNGCRFEFQGRTYESNYDGSQDEGEQTSDAVLRAFLEPFAGDDAGAWPTDQVKLIAINEGRLVDFLSSEGDRFPLLSEVVSAGLVSAEPVHGVAVINLNLRSVVSDSLGNEGDSKGGDDSILSRLVRRMTHHQFWESCQQCDLRDKCYAFHNARTFHDETGGPKVAERIKALYTLTHLRGRLHITLRDLRSALAFMLVGTRDCDEIHELYRAGDRDEIVQGFYFNSWMGGARPNADRLLSLLREVDVGLVSDPRLDRSLDFVTPAVDHSLFRFEQRGGYDREVLGRLFDDLPREFGGKFGAHRIESHQNYVAMARRRSFFERRDSGWRRMLPYQTGEDMLALVKGERTPDAVLPELLHAINRGEGLTDPERLGGSLALQVREVAGGTIRSYRLYAKDRFTLNVRDSAARARFVEHMPDSIVLRYRAEAGNDAEMPINLDVFEMLQRLNEGYRPSVEEQQGYYLSLAVFKNVLGSAPYQEVLLTTTGYDFFRVQRHADGRLDMDRVATEAS